jgi:hypothetical protein
LRDSLFGTTPTVDGAVALRGNRVQALGRLTEQQRNTITVEELIRAGYTGYEVRLIMTQVLRRSLEEEGEMDVVTSQTSGPRRFSEAFES